MQLEKSLMQPYKCPLTIASAEFTEKKSRFIGNISPVDNEEEALAFIANANARFKDATHNVYAYRLKENGTCRFSDAGEPAGTAGMPLLDVFLKQDIYDFCCIITRYFGGIMLGAGGLVRAYSHCGSITLKASGIGVMAVYAIGELSFDYSLYDILKRLILQLNAKIEEEVFTDRVKVKLLIVADKWEELSEKVVTATAGTVMACKIREVFYKC